jgi:fructokinase
MLLAVGEALFDWVCQDPGLPLERATRFTRAPGGAPLNVAVGLARLGVPVSFAGCLADDPFGDELAALLMLEGVGVSAVRRVTGRQTRMAYVTTRADGDRELAAFSRAACADGDLAARDLSDDLLAGVDGFYFGSLILSGATPRAAVLEAAARVRASGGLVCFDPNVRPVLWSDEAKLQRVLRAGLEVASIVKLDPEELARLSGSTELEEGAEHLLAAHALDAVLVTYGAEGSAVRLRGRTIRRPAPHVEAVDATGAGDGFLAALLAGLWDARLAGERLATVPVRLDEAGWQALLARANAAGALVTTRAGAIAALPRRQELEALI